MRCCEGVLAEAHSNVFVVRTEGIPSEISCSYVDVLCGDAVVCPCADKSPPNAPKAPAIDINRAVPFRSVCDRV